MSQNGPYSGPPWSHGSSDEPYTEPADPWGDQSTVPEPAWGAQQPPVQQPPASYQAAPDDSPMRGRPASPPPRRNTTILALVITVVALIIIGLATAWLLNERSKAHPQAEASPSAVNTGVAPLGTEDARFNVKEGDCVVNEGTDDKPEMRATVCTSGTYEVLKRIAGKATGEKDAESKCAKVQGYTKWFFYDSSLDDLDFVLCLKDH